MTAAQRYLLVLAAVFVCAFAAVWLWTIYEREGFLDADYGQWRAKMTMMDRCDVGKVAILGDSRASAAYVPRLLGSDVRNLALTGATPVETYYAARRIMQCPHSPRVVVLAFSPRQFEEIDWLWLHAVSYGQLDTAALREIAAQDARYPNSQLYHGAFGSEPPPLMKNWMYAHHFPPYDFAAMLAAGGFGRKAVNRRIMDETLRQGGQHVNGTPRTCTSGPAWEVGQTRFAVTPLVGIYLQKMLTLFRDKRVRVIMGPIPVNPRTAASMNRGFVDGYTAFLTSATKDFANVTVSDRLLPMMGACAFGDPHHVNQAGADAFSTAYASELNAHVKGPESIGARSPRSGT